MINQNDTFRSYAAKIEEIYNNWEKVTAENTEMILSPTRKGKMGLTLKGNTEQETTTGKNLFDISAITVGYGLNASGVPYANSDWNCWTEYIEITPNTAYCFFTNVANIQRHVCTYDENKTFIERFNITNTNTITTNANAKYVRCAYRNNQNPTQIQLEKGSTATTYEKYTGGIASPNPSYPSDVEVVTGNNTITISNSDNTQSQVYPINLGNMEMCSIGDYDDYFQIENDTWYKYGVIGKAIRTGDVSEVWSLQSINSHGIANFLTSLQSNYEEDQSKIQNQKCNRFSKQTTLISQTTDEGFLPTYNTSTQVLGVYFRISQTRANTVESLKTWLSSNNIILYYTLATPEITEITDETLIEQLNNIYENAKSYQDETNISQTNDNLPFIISASALKKGGI